MDRILPKKQKYKKYYKYFVSAFCIVFFLILLSSCINKSIQTSTLKYKDLLTSKAVLKDLDASFSMDGIVKPVNSYNLETSVGGKVIKILKQTGDQVITGEPIALLENNELLLQFISQETAVTEQENNLNNAKIQGSQNQLTQKRLLSEYEFLLNKLNRSFENKKKLFNNKFISEDEFQDAKDELELNKLKANYLREEIKNDSLMRSAQIKQLEQSVTQIRLSLDQMKAKVKDLNVKAPISGVITDMDLKLGQIVSSGTKIALIEDLSNLFIEANVNQFYSSQLQIGLPVVYEANNKKFTTYIEKINPKLSNDKVYMDLKGEISPDLKSGQNVSCDVIASKLKNVIVIPLGEYLQQTDYQWVFVLNKEKNKAVRKQIKLGKRNLSEVQVLEGLDTTDEIIVSSYQNYLKKDYLIIK